MNLVLKEGIRLRAEGYYHNYYSHKGYGKIREWLIKYFIRKQLRIKNIGYKP